MRIGIIGGGVIARLVLKHMADGALGDMHVVAICGRSERSKGKALAGEFKGPFVIGRDALVGSGAEVVVEAASHDAVREYGEALLARGISFVALSRGALCDHALRPRFWRTSAP